MTSNAQSKEFFNDQVIKTVENKIGYAFKNKELVLLAFTRRSQNEFNNNEFLEFFGDSALGLVITKKMADRYVYTHTRTTTRSASGKPQKIIVSKANMTIADLFNTKVLRLAPIEDPITVTTEHTVCDYTEGDMTEIKKSLVSTGAL